MMRPEIGSNFWEYDLSTKREKKFWWEDDEYNVVFTKSGRNSLKAVCDLLQQTRDSHVVLLPEYLCETEIDPWREGGWDVRFYVVSRDYTIDLDSLKSGIENNHPVAVLIQRYYGFDTISKEVEEYLKQVRQDGVVLIEDVTQTLFEDCYTDFCDYYTGSLRKFFAIPEGGVLISKRDLGFAKLSEEERPIDQISREAYALKKEYFVTMDPETKNRFRNLYEDALDKIGINDKLYAISELSGKIFDTFDFAVVSEKRKANFDLLTGLLEKIPQVELVFHDKCGKYIPLYLPIYLETEEKRNECRQYLASKDIYCPIIWPKPEYYDVKNAESLYIYDHILCMPIDQRYDADDMERIAQELRNWTQK